MRPFHGSAIPALLLLMTAGATADVRVVVEPDGTPHMYNAGAPRTEASMNALKAADPVGDLDPVIERFSRDSRIEAALVRAVIKTESDFDARAVSRKGAMGLMQLMPETADALDVADPFDPVENVRAGTRYLRRMLDAFGGEVELALAAYNAGPETVRRFAGIPPYSETIRYVERVMRLYRGDPDYSIRSSASLGKGRRTYLTRDSRGVLLLTTTPPRGG